MNFIEKLQNKPKKTRILILWISSGFAMLVVILFWVCFFTGNNVSKNAESDLEKTELPSLFESAKQDFLIFKEKIGASLKEIKEQETKLEELNEEQE
jgi:flagellar basal body-associated protein FliL